jgi:hypothetical protein
MASGQQISAMNIAKFESWIATQTDDDYRQIVNAKGSLKRGEIATILDFSRSVFNQNPTVRKLLDNLEKELRDRKVLPQIVIKEEKTLKAYDQSKNKNMVNQKRLSGLEKEVIELRAENEMLKKSLSHLSEFKEALSELGNIPQ